MGKPKNEDVWIVVINTPYYPYIERYNSKEEAEAEYKKVIEYYKDEILNTTVYLAKVIKERVVVLIG